MAAETNNPACLRLNIKGKSLGDYIIADGKPDTNGLTEINNFSIDPQNNISSPKNKSVRFTISFDIDKAKIEPYDFFLSEDDEKRLLSGDIAYLELKENDGGYEIDVKQMPVLALTPKFENDQFSLKVKISFILLSYYLEDGFSGGKLLGISGKLPGTGGKLPGTGGKLPGTGGKLPGTGSGPFL